MSVTQPRPRPRRHFIVLPIVAAAAAAAAARSMARAAAQERTGLRPPAHTPGIPRPPGQRVRGRRLQRSGHVARAGAAGGRRAARARRHAGAADAHLEPGGPVRAVRQDAPAGQHEGDPGHPHGGPLHLAGRRRAWSAPARGHGACLDRRLRAAAGRGRRAHPARHAGAGGAGSVEAHRAPADERRPCRDRPHRGDAGAGARRRSCRRDTLDAPRQRLRADAATPSELPLGAACRRRARRLAHRGRPPPAARDGQGHDPREDARAASCW